MKMRAENNQSQSVMLGALTVWVLCVLLNACVGSNVTIAPNVAIDPLRDATFAWEVEAIKPHGRSESMYYLDHYLRREVEKQLVARGYRATGREKADFLVKYRFFQQASVDQGGLVSPHDSASAAWDTAQDPNNTAIYHHYIPAQIFHASLELTLQSTLDQRILWHATLNKIVGDETVDKSALKKTVEQHVPTMFRGLPSRR